MKNANTASKKISTSKLFRNIVSLVMVMALLASCSLMLIGCSKNDDNSGNKNDASQYEGLTGKEYLQKLESNNLGAMIDSLGNAYKAFIGTPDANPTYGAKLDLTLNLGDDLLDTVGTLVFGSSEMDLSFLSKINLNLDMFTTEQLSKAQMALGLNGQKVLTLNMLLSLSDSVMYLGAPDLNDTYLKLNMSEMMDNTSANSAMSSAALTGTLAKALPDADTLTTVLNRYLNLVVAELNNVEQSTATLEAGGLKQDCTKLTAKIYEADAAKIAKAVLTAAKDDADLKKIIEGVAKAAAELSGEDVNADEAYTEFKDGITEMLEDLNETEDFDADSYIELIAYVDKDHNIIGHKLSIIEGNDAEELFYYHTVTEGDKFACVVNIADGDMKISGNGTEANGKTNGDFTISAEGTDVVTLKVEDMTEEGGTLTFAPTAKAEEEMGLDTLPFKKLSLRIKLGNDSIELNVLSESKLLAGIALKASESNGPDLSVPSNAADVTDSTALQQWAGKLALNKLIDNLKKAGVPDALLNIVPGYAEAG